VSTSSPITFQFLHTPFRLKQRPAVRAWLQQCVADAGETVGELNFLFTNDEEMLALNRRHLDHDFLTDILTFPLASGTGVSADIVISIDRTRENAKTLKTNPMDEIHRVMAHGVLHLLGRRDDTRENQKIMRQTEDHWLQQRDFLSP